MEHTTALAGREATNWLDTAQLADYLGVAKRTIEDWRNVGNGPPYCRAGGRLVRYSRAEVDQWLASTRVKSTSEEHAAT